MEKKDTSTKFVDLPDEEKDVKIYRILTLFPIILIPLFGPIYKSTLKNAFDPMIYRYSIGIWGVVLLISSYVSEYVQKRIVFFFQRFQFCFSIVLTFLICSIFFCMITFSVFILFFQKSRLPIQ